MLLNYFMNQFPLEVYVLRGSEPQVIRLQVMNQLRLSVQTQWANKPLVRLVLSK
jgi:hypothetical protein